MSFYYDEYTDQIIDQSGQRYPRPPDWPRETLRTVPRSMPQPPITRPARWQPTGISNFYSYGDLQSPTQEMDEPSSQQTVQQPPIQQHRRRRSNLQSTPSSPSQLPTQLSSLSISPQETQPPQSHQSPGPSRISTTNSTFRTAAGPSTTREESNRLHTNYKRPVKPKRFFTVGKVFLMLWTEPAGESAPISGPSRPRSTSGISTGSYGEKVFSKIRRFIVVREGGDSCTALMIKTYDGDGVSRKGVRKCEHAVIYSGRKAPLPDARETPARGEDGLLPQYIRVDPDDPSEKLDEMSRIDFGKVYTIEHNVKVRSLGKINRSSLQPLLYQMRSVWASSMGIAPAHENGSYSLVDWSYAYNTLLNSGWTDARARAVLRSDFQFIQVPGEEDPSYEDQTTAARSEGSSKEGSDQRSTDKDNTDRNP